MQKIANPPGSASYLEMARAVASSIGRWRVLTPIGATTVAWLLCGGERRSCRTADSCQRCAVV